MRESLECVIYRMCSLDEDLRVEKELNKGIGGSYGEKEKKIVSLSPDHADSSEA